VGQVSFADWSAVIATHLNGFFLCASEAVPRMVARGKGSIVSIASTAAFVGLPGRGAYCAAKAGILGLTRALSLEVATAGVRVNAVAPGFTRTKLIEQGLADGSLQEDWMVARVPMGRLAGPHEIANAVRWLAGDEASYVTGQTIVVDGGWTVQGIPEAPSWLRPPAGEA
jgi:NAD(P)-dependent dehydrogenase (short-subunit alcohol dehydrogenase family)